MSDLHACAAKQVVSSPWGAPLLGSPSPFAESHAKDAPRQIPSKFRTSPLESGGGAFLTVIFGQILAYCAFSDSHFSSPGSLSALMASTGHSGSHTPQSMHSSGWMTSMFSPSLKQSAGTTSTMYMVLQR